MKAGQKVTIYEDPVTQQNPEGEAVLVEKVDTDNSGVWETGVLEWWKVWFPGEDTLYERKVFVRRPTGITQALMQLRGITEEQAGELFEDMVAAVQDGTRPDVVLELVGLDEKWLEALL